MLITQTRIHKLPLELSTGLRLRVLGNYVNSRKPLKHLELNVSTQLITQKEDFERSVFYFEKYEKSAVRHSLEKLILLDQDHT